MKKCIEAIENLTLPGQNGVQYANRKQQKSYLTSESERMAVSKFTYRKEEVKESHKRASSEGKTLIK